MNAAVCDSVMVGLAKRLQRGELKRHREFVTAYTQLLNDADYAMATKTATSDEANVNLRLEKATKAFTRLG